jgi:hypothetical protein
LLLFIIIGTKLFDIKYDFIELRPHDLNKYLTDSHLFALGSDIVQVLPCGQEVTFGTFSRVGRPLRIREVTAWDGDKSEERMPEPYPVILIHQDAVTLTLGQ